MTLIDEITNHPYFEVITALIAFSFFAGFMLGLIVMAHWLDILFVKENPYDKED